MADPFLAEIRVFPYTFAPTGWAFCDGQILPLSQNTALFALLGTTYGGDGKSTFALPDLQGSAPMHPNHDLNDRAQHQLGEMGGSQTVSLLQSEIPSHAHTVQGSTGIGNAQFPTPSMALARSTGGAAYEANPAAAPRAAMAPQTLAPAGGDLPHNNMMPSLAFHFCIALQGVFPARP